MRFSLLRITSAEDEVNYRNIREFEDAIASDPEVREESWGAWRSGIARGLRAGWKKLALPPRASGAYEWGGGDPGGVRFAVLLGPSFHRCTALAAGGRKAAYLFDATEPWTTPGNVARFVTEAGISDLFVDHPQFVDPIQRLAGRCRVHFVPHGIDPRCYRAAAEKDIDVLEFGRKMPGYHEALVGGLAARGIVHHHGFIDSRAGFVDCLSRAKISISFPRSMTDGSPELPMLTLRYLQSIASKALVVGQAPPLLKELFGYDPVIPANLDDPCGQIAGILADFGSFRELLERNHRVLVEGHTFQHRWAEIKALLQSPPTDFKPC